MENTPTGRMIFSIVSGFAEFERDVIVGRGDKATVYLRNGFSKRKLAKFSWK